MLSLMESRLYQQPFSLQLHFVRLHFFFFFFLNYYLDQTYDRSIFKADLIVVLVWKPNLMTRHKMHVDQSHDVDNVQRYIVCCHFWPPRMVALFCCYQKPFSLQLHFGRLLFLFLSSFLYQKSFSLWLHFGRLLFLFYFILLSWPNIW